MKVPWLDRLPPTPRRRILWGAGLLLFYTVFGFLILPLIVRAVAVRQIARQLDREVSIAQVKINPYALSGTLRGLLIKDKDGQPFLSFDEAYGNFQLMSFLGHPWVFKEISTTKPFVRAQVNKDRSLNFSDLLEKFSRIDTNAPPPKPAKPLALRIGQVRITGASASLADLTPRTPFRRIVGPLNITLNNFHTDPENRTQVEGFAVDSNISFSDLKGMLTAFAKRMFGQNQSTRFKPSFFPFTEPSAQVDVKCFGCQGSGCRLCKQSGWIEMLGAGLIHPNVFRASGYDPDVISGYAFGMGVERIAMLKYNILDIRMFFENDMSFLEQF